MKTEIKIKQRVLESGYSHLETILLIDDNEATRLSDEVVGYFHCKQCGAFQAYAGKLPPKNMGDGINFRMHNERNAFWRAHCHGDGRILLFEKDIPDEESEEEKRISQKGF